MRMFFRTLFLVAAASLVTVERAAAQDQLSFLRDAEIEGTIRTFATPVWKAAGLDPQAIHIYIINDPALNAFVAGGQNLFMNSGTILRAATPNQLVGVMAHETGHIAGGHLARMTQMMHNAMVESIIGMLLGGVATVASHGSGGGGPIIAGESVGQRAFLQNTVIIEASADQAALRFLDRSHQSSRGLLEFFQVLEQEMFLNAQHQDPYLQNHPLTEDRIAYVKEHVDQSPYSDVKDPPEWVALNNIMRAKLEAFMWDPQQVLAKWKADDNSEPARYARAIAYYRIPDLKNALALIDGLIADHPSNPFYQELKGQMLFENGRVADAVAPYERAAQLKPGEPLLNIELAQVQLETNDPTLVPKAKEELNAALRVEDDNAEAWRFLAIAYGRSGELGLAALAIAEQNMAEGNYREAAQQADRAQKQLPPGPQRQRAQDLAQDAKRAQHDQQN
jgi:predicted Zn-dependent protease